LRGRGKILHREKEGNISTNVINSHFSIKIPHFSNPRIYTAVKFYPFLNTLNYVYIVAGPIMNNKIFISITAF
jgi:hypothetical protein